MVMVGNEHDGSTRKALYALAGVNQNRVNPPSKGFCPSHRIYLSSIACNRILCFQTVFISRFSIFEASLKVQIK